jgi:hypothetical protein
VKTRGDVVAVNALPGTVAAAPRPKNTQTLVEQAAELLPGNEFAAQITGMLTNVKGAAA